MAEFYVEINARDNGDHLVHTSTCSLLPTQNVLRYLGSISNTKSAVKKASEHLTQVNGCAQCTPAYQTF